MRVHFSLYTDGSCSSRDGVGGYCAILLDHRTKNHYALFGGSNFTSVPRQEFSALLHGLEKIFSLLNWKVTSSCEKGKPSDIKIEWYCDREDLVNSVNTKRTGFKRKATPDLWARLEYFEEFVTIIPINVPRNTHPFQALSDKVAGEFRKMVCNYISDGNLNAFKTLT